MSSAPTAEIIIESDGDGSRSYETWRDYPARRLASATALPDLIRAGAMAILLTTTRSVSGYDLRQVRDPQWSSSVMGSVVRPIAVRRISLTKARQIALEIVAEAELERFRIAEWEARRGLVWED